MTHPFVHALDMSCHLLTCLVCSELADGKDLFGEGNIPDGFRSLPDTHDCNHFCDWFGLASMKQTIG